MPQLAPASAQAAAPHTAVASSGAEGVLRKPPAPLGSGPANRLRAKPYRYCALT